MKAADMNRKRNLGQSLCSSSRTFPSSPHQLNRSAKLILNLNSETRTEAYHDALSRCALNKRRFREIPFLEKEILWAHFFPSILA